MNSDTVSESDTISTKTECTASKVLWIKEGGCRQVLAPNVTSQTGP